MKTKILFLLFVLLPLAGNAQQQRVYNEQVRSLQLLVDDDPLPPPILTMHKGQQLTIGFDELSHEYHRYMYHIDHCEADWSVSEEIFESDYLSGLNDQPIEDYEKSFNTTQLYTHYKLTLPNEQTQLRISGNYRVTITDDENPDEPVVTAEFCILDSKMSISAQVSSNTDIDFNQHHQQLTYAISYGNVQVIDPRRELHTVVMQNRRHDNAVIDLQPNIQKANGIEFTHQRALIFPAGNEFHKFELLDVHRPGLNIDNLRWYDPYYHATLYADEPARNYTYNEDQDGGFVIRNEWQDGPDETTSEYVLFHFTLQTEEALAGQVYLCGQWTNGPWDPQCLMEYDADAHQYNGSLYLKQGYYNYQYRLLTDEGEAGTTLETENDFFETENEYLILVYDHPQGARYDQLVGFAKVKTDGRNI